MHHPHTRRACFTSFYFTCSLLWLFRSPLPSREGFAGTPTTATLLTPEPVPAQLDNEGRHHSQFIFYPISWDGTESVPSSEIKDDTSAKSNSNEEFPPNIEAPGPVGRGEELIGCAPPTYCSDDPFRRIDRWRRHITRCTCGTSELLEPLEMEGCSPSSPVLSTRRQRDSEDWYPVLFSATSNSEDDVRVWVDDGIFGGRVEKYM
ncbi:hypothetical protein F5I97DRAFT_1873180 [Phlebopus sp. FC_14]|nr:hypothetical protein F5I97DRAFT_1873180 [Phlebopus sp. FC_14]